MEHSGTTKQKFSRNGPLARRWDDCAAPSIRDKTLHMYCRLRDLFLFDGKGDAVIVKNDICIIVRLASFQFVLLSDGFAN